MWPPVSIIWRLLYRSQGRYSEAEPLYQQALALRQKLLGDEHPDVATSFNNLGMLRFHHYAEAADYLGKALTLIERLLGPDHPNTQTMRGNLEFVRQKL
jgi:tetratricopeptide (TPR) repeat protein